MAARRHPAAGFTLIELIMFIVIVSVGLAGVLVAFNFAATKSADPLVQKQVLRVAEGTMQEILEKSYQNDPSDPNNASTTLGCTPFTTPQCLPNTPAQRANYNDVDDYNGFSQTGITQLDGVTPVSGLSGYTVTISVNKTTATLGSLTGSTQVKQITVVVSRGSVSVTLVGYRTNYGY